MGSLADHMSAALGGTAKSISDKMLAFFASWEAATTGQTLIKQADGTLAPGAVGGGGGAVPVIGAKRTAGNFALNQNTWNNATMFSLRLVIPAAVGDVLEMQACGLVGNEAPSFVLDVETNIDDTSVNSVAQDAAAPVAGVSSTGPGIASWCKDNGALYSIIGGGVIYTVKAEDRDGGGNVTLIPRYRTGGAVTFFASASNPFRWFVKNLKH